MSYSCTNIDVAELRLSMTLDKASDLHKSVISAYKCEAGNESNVATLSRIPSLVLQPNQAVLFILVLRL